MASSTKILLTILILGVITADLAESFCRPGARPIIAGTVALPTNPEILPLSVFSSEVVGETLYNIYQGAPLGAPVFEDFEVVFTTPTPDIVDVFFKFVFNGTCVIQDRNFTEFFPGDRAEFGSESGTYSSIFTSDPSSYVWVLICRGTPSGPRRRCPVGNLILSLFTRNNPPDNLNLESVGRDLRTRTCLNMELIPGVFNFLSVQGENDCSAQLAERLESPSPF